MDDSKSKSSKDVDIYRDTPVRLLGYANEVGESFRAKIGPRWVLATYGLSTAYVIADTIDKSIKTYNKSKVNGDQIEKTAYAATDAFIWQMLASVLVPGFTINRACALSNYMLSKNVNLKASRREWLVICIGICVIPFIIKPIDHSMDKLMDNTLRKLYTLE
ncbi:hypothetical protein AMK59_3412 [Oryctes borbonicus]|uniref:Mitochondrial fission process protein 1 n=1 Tax=Oryctes borbonicus TaxID=1629725 RepID=A0A0T6B9I5_9SCAR|nr:hypothetical protein AMK59_3412 [Oryctes borbonicus]